MVSSGGVRCQGEEKNKFRVVYLVIKYVEGVFIL